MQAANAPWHELANDGEVPSPALLIYPDRVEQNIQRMLQIAGGPERLRPHVKTHKLAEVVRMQLAHGIRKFKCATIAEAEMTTACGARADELASPPVRHTLARLLHLARKFPATRFSTLADDEVAIRALPAGVAKANLHI